MSSTKFRCSTSQSLIALEHLEIEFKPQNLFPTIVKHISKLNVKIKEYDEIVAKDLAACNYYFAKGDLWLRISNKLAKVYASLITIFMITIIVLSYMHYGKTSLVFTILGSVTIIGLFIYAYTRQKENLSPFAALGFVLSLLASLISILSLLFSLL